MAKRKKQNLVSFNHTNAKRIAIIWLLTHGVQATWKHKDIWVIAELKKHPELPASLKSRCGTWDKRDWWKDVHAFRNDLFSDWDDFLRMAVTGSPRKPPVRNKKADFYGSSEWKKLRYRVLKTYGTRCMCCGADPVPGKPPHVDHIKPRSRFPELELSFDNLQVLCGDCNEGKSAWDKTDWRPKAKIIALRGGEA